MFCFDIILTTCKNSPICQFQKEEVGILLSAVNGRRGLRMLKSLMKKRLVTLFLLCSVVYAAGTTGDSTKMMDNVNVNGRNVEITGNDANESTLVGDDQLPKEDIYGGKVINVNKGEEDNSVELKQDESGRVYLQKKNGDPNDPNSYPQFQSKDNTQEAREYQQRYENYQKLPLSEKNDPQTQRNAKQEMYNELERRKDNFTNMERYFLRNKNLIQGATTYYQNTQRNLLDPNGNPQEAVDLEKNATKLYKTTVGTRDFSKQTQYYLKNVENLGVLSKAYENLNALKDTLNSHSFNPFIKCQISRGLVPGYMCPLPGKDQVTLPAYTQGSDLRRINLVEAKDKCNKYCYSDPDEHSCKERKLIPSGQKTWSLLSSPKEIWPNKSVITKEKDLDGRLMTTAVHFVFKLTHDNSITDEDLENFLKNNDTLKIKYSVYGFASEDFDNEMSDFPGLRYSFEDGTTIKFDSTIIDVYVPIQRPIKKIGVTLYEPYFAEFPIYRSEYDEERRFFEDHHVKLFIEKIEGEYASDGIYFCMPLQTVASPSYCNGDAEEIDYGDAQYRFLCLDDQHKIGPAIKGGFYSKESCVQRCVVHKQCIPTYRHYNVAGMQESSWFKSKITCVDDETNKNCTDDLCLQYFMREHNAEMNHDYSKRPIEEQVVYNDDRVVYTIKDGTLTDETRPKIDLPGELNNETIENLKIKEEKDIALKNMITRGTYNRSIYKIGENSPMNMAYIKAVNGSNRTYLAALLKPNSEDFDNGINYKIYVLYRIEHIFKPKYGEWLINGHMVSTHDANLIIKDVTYAIENGNKKLIPFRRDLFREFLLGRDGVTNPNPSDQNSSSSSNTVPSQNQGTQNTGTSSSSSSSQPQPYTIASDRVWTEIPRLQRFENIVPPSTNVPFFKEMKFTNASPYYQFELLDDVEKTILETEGIIIHDQLPKDYETDIIRKYDGPINMAYKSNIWNFSVYMLYLPASQQISYADLLCKLAKEDTRRNGSICLDIKKPWNTKYGLFDFLNPAQFRSGEVKHDGEINNRIKMFLMGDPSRMSVSMKISPSITERGKRLYKFIFLYDEDDPLVIINRETEAPAGTNP